MITFLFGWMGSAVFWILYATLTLFIGTFLLRVYAKNTYNFIKGNHTSDYYDTPDFVGVAFMFYLFWPFILMWLIFWTIFKIAMIDIFGPLMKKTINSVDALIPNIEITKKG